MKERVASLSGSALQHLRKSAQGPRVVLMAILLVSFLLCNHANMSGNNWVIHPDDHEAYVLGRNLKESGSLSREEPLNRLFDRAVFTPAGAISFEQRVVPTRALGIYFVAAAGFFLGDQGPLYILPLFGLVALLFLFKLASLLTDERKALLTTFLVALSAPFIYWNTMLYANIPSLAFLLGGIYFLMKIAYSEEKGNPDYLLAALFFGLAVWMRYEAILIILMLLPVVISRRKSYRIAPLLVGALLLVAVLLPIAMLNQSLYRNPVGVGYAKGAADLSQGETVETKSDISSIYHRFIENYFKPDTKRIYDNAFAYLIQPFPMLLLAGLLGLLGALSDRTQKRSFAVSMLLVLVVWTYYVLNAGLWSGSSGALTSSYFRYLLIVYAVLAIFAPVFLERFRAIGTGTYRVVILFFVISFLVLQLTLLSVGPFGFKDTNKIKADYKKIDAYFSSQTPEKTVVIASLYSKAIASRPVLRPRAVGTDGLDPTAGQIKELLEKGYQVYLMEAPGHAATFMDLSTFITQRRNDMQVQTVALLPVSGSEKVEKVVLVEP